MRQRIQTETDPAGKGERQEVQGAARRECRLSLRALSTTRGGDHFLLRHRYGIQEGLPRVGLLLVFGLFERRPKAASPALRTRKRIALALLCLTRRTELVKSLKPCLPRTVKVPPSGAIKHISR